MGTVRNIVDRIAIDFNSKIEIDPKKVLTSEVYDKITTDDEYMKNYVRSVLVEDSIVNISRILSEGLNSESFNDTNIISKFIDMLKKGYQKIIATVIGIRQSFMENMIKIFKDYGRYINKHDVEIKKNYDKYKDSMMVTTYNYDTTFYKNTNSYRSSFMKNIISLKSGMKYIFIKKFKIVSDNYNDLYKIMDMNDKDLAILDDELSNINTLEKKETAYLKTCSELIDTPVKQMSDFPEAIKLKFRGGDTPKEMKLSDIDIYDIMEDLRNNKSTVASTKSSISMTKKIKMGMESFVKALEVSEIGSTNLRKNLKLNIIKKLEVLFRAGLDIELTYFNTVLNMIRERTVEWFRIIRLIMKDE